MAEALAVIGTIASTVQLVESISKLVNRVESCQHTAEEAPKMLRFTNIRLLFFIRSLQLVQPHIDHRLFSPQKSSMLQMMIDECDSQMITVDEIVASLATVDGDSRITKSLKAFGSLKQEKELDKTISTLSVIEKLLLFQIAVTSGIQWQTRS